MRKLGFAVALLAATSVRAEQLLPTVEGTAWEYQSTETITGNTGPVRSLVTVRASKDTLDGKEVVKLETFSNNAISKTELIETDSNGISCLARTGRDGKMTKLVPPEKIVSGPLRVGAKWDQEAEVAGIRMRQQWKVVAEGTVTVPASQFQAFHLHCEDSSLMSVKLDRWFAPGVGIVKEVSVARGPGMLHRVTLELQKLTEAPPPKVDLPPPSSVPPLSEKASPPDQSTSSPAAVSTKEEGSGPNEKQVPGPEKKLTVEVSSDATGGLKTEFKSNVANIYVRWQGHGLKENALVRVAWVAEDVGDLVDPGFVVDEIEAIAPVSDASARFTLGRPPDGWAEGKYRLEFYIDEVLTETVKVTIVK